MDANGLVVMPGKGPAWKMAPGRSSTLKATEGDRARRISTTMRLLSRQIGRSVDPSPYIY